MSDPSIDFELFKSTFKKYQERFGLSGYQVYFEHKPLTDSFAELTTQEGMVATATLTTTIEDSNVKHKDIQKSAKHEAIHLLINRLEYLALNRFSTREEIFEADEELVNKLCTLIGDI